MKYLRFKNENHKLDFYTESAIREQVKRTGINKDVITEAYNMLFQCVVEEISKGSLMGPQKYKSIHIHKLGTFVPKTKRIEFLANIYSIKSFKLSYCKRYDDYYGVCILIDKMATDINKMKEVMEDVAICKEFGLQSLNYILTPEDCLFLEKLGYKEDIGTYYDRSNPVKVLFKSTDDIGNVDKLLAPTYVQAFDWIYKTFFYKVEFKNKSLSYTISVDRKYRPEKVIVTNFLDDGYKANFLGFEALCKHALNYMFIHLLNTD
jgi:hypothetical protein